MTAVKENRVYTITETDAESFRKEGYDIYDDNGELIAYGLGKSVPYDKYMELKKAYETLMEQCAELEDKLAKKAKKE